MSKAPSTIRLNAVEVSLPSEAAVIVRREKYGGPEQLRTLQSENSGSHLVWRRGDEIELVAYSAAAVGPCAQRMRLSDRPDLAQRLVNDWLARELTAKGLRVSNGPVLQYVSEKPESNLLAFVVGNQFAILPGVGRRQCATFEARRVWLGDGPPKVVVAVDVRTRITLDCTVADLIERGFDPSGLYVLQECIKDGRPARQLAGRVSRIDGATAYLDDCRPDGGQVPTRSIWLEPRKENFERVVRLLGGRDGDRALELLFEEVHRKVGGAARAAQVDKWFALIEKLPAEIAQGIKIAVGRQSLRANAMPFPRTEVYEKPFLVFDVGGTKTEKWNQGGLDRFGPYNHERFAPRKLAIALICQANWQGDVERFIQKLLNGVPGSKYAANGMVSRYRLDPPVVRVFPARSPSATHYREAVAAAIESSTTNGQRWNLALVQIDEGFRALDGDLNPYLVAKALFLAQQVPSQSFEHESISVAGTQLEVTINNIGLACYAKVNGVPWVLPVHQTVSHEFVIGLGSYEASETRMGGRERYIGVTTVFSADGRYMLESRTPATPASDYLPALLSSLERVVGEVRSQQAWSDDQAVRFIFHVFKDFNQREIEAVKSLMTRLKLPHATFAFVHIVEDHPFMAWDTGQGGIAVGQQRKGEYAAPRGLRIDLSGHEALLCLKGPGELRRPTDGTPKPVLIRIHRDSTFRDLSYLSRQIFDFTCLSWRTLLPSPLPISVVYSDLVAQNLLNLRDVTGWTPEHVLGPVGRSRWFL